MDIVIHGHKLKWSKSIRKFFPWKFGFIIPTLVGGHVEYAGTGENGEFKSLSEVKDKGK